MQLKSAILSCLLTIGCFDAEAPPPIPELPATEQVSATPQLRGLKPQASEPNLHGLRPLPGPPELHGLKPPPGLPELHGLEPRTWQEQLERTAVSLHLGGSFCTGTWVSKHAVLTAAHCVVDKQQRSFQIVPQADARQPVRALATADYRVHPSYAVATVLKKGDLIPVFAADFAVVEVPAGMPVTARLAILDFASVVKPNTPQWSAGYGHTGLVQGAPQGSGVLRHAQFNTVYKFENNDRTPNTVGFYWLLAGQNGKACNGDSGGPAFWTSNKTIMQFGVNSYISRATPEQANELLRLEQKERAGQPLTLAELAFVYEVAKQLAAYDEQSCSPYLQVASVGEARDWIQSQYTAIEAKYP